MFSKECGVSPVVANILMIAVTIILVSVLFFTVLSGYLSTPYAIDQFRATLVFDSPDSTYNEVYFNIALSSPQSISPYDVKITITHGSQMAHLTYTGNFIWSNATSGGAWHYEAKLIDKDGNGKFSNGDTLIVYVVDDNPSDNISPPPFQSGDRVVFSITGYNGISAGGVVNF